MNNAYGILQNMKNRLQTLLPGASKLNLIKGGYTVVEVLIVLSISGLLFFSVITLISGKQARTQFEQSIRTYEAEIQNVVSETSNGYYRTEVSCNVSGGIYSFGGPGSADPGKNSECVFAGKVIAPHSDETFVFTMVGSRNNSSGEAATSIAESQPTLVPGDNIVETNTHRFGLEVVKMVDIASGVQVKAIAYFLPVSGGVTNINVTGSESGVILYGLTGVVGAAAESDISSSIQDLTNDSAVFPMPEGVVICFDNGNNFFAEMRVGASGSQSGISTTTGDSFQSGGLCE